MNKNNPKIAMFCVGTPPRYRLDILLKSCPSITKDYIIIFTTKYYYDLYKDYHNDFEFVAIDDLRKDNAVSLQNELCMEAPNDEEYYKKYPDFYQFQVNGTAFPLFLARYALKYFAEHNILNFMICDTDMVIKNNVDAIKDLFNNIAKGTVYAWNQGCFSKTSEMAGNVSNCLQTNIQPLFPQLKFDMALHQFRNDDSFIYGGHFHNREDLMLLFNLVDTMITESFVNNYKHLYGSTPYHNFIWVYPAAYDLLSNNLNYEYKDAQSITHLPKYGCIMVHKSRPEDTFHFFGQRGSQWSNFSFDYSDITSIPKFIQNNKQQLKNYYAEHLPVLEITDTHVYTYLPN